MPDRVEALQSRSGAVKSAGHLDHDISKGAQHVETKTEWLEAGVVARRSQKGEEMTDPPEEFVNRLDEHPGLFEFSEDRLPVADGFEVGRNHREDAFDEVQVLWGSRAPYPSGHAAGHQLREKKIVGEMSRHPIGFAARLGVELTVDLAGAGAAEKGEVEQSDEAVGARTCAGPRRKKIGHRDLTQRSAVSAGPPESKEVHELTERGSVAVPWFFLLHNTPRTVLGAAAKNRFANNHLQDSTLPTRLKFGSSGVS